MLDEMVNSHYDQLNENDLYIWQYIYHHKSDCQKMSIQELARTCNVSHTSIIRFCKKIGLDGYSELKIHLKWSMKKQFDFDSQITVSYTHLDVYKRQSIFKHYFQVKKHWYWG